MTNNSTMINELQKLGATNISVNGQCWSLTLPNGRHWSGGVGAVRSLVAASLHFIPPRRVGIKVKKRS